MTNLKKWIETSDWRIWLVGAIMIVFLVSFIRESILEYSYNKKRQEMMTFIDGTEDSINQTRNDAVKSDQVIDAEFDRVMQSSLQVISKGHQQLNSIRQK